MKCHWYQRWITASADDELRGWRAAWLRSHVSACPHCASDLAQLRRLRELVASRKTDYMATLDNRQFWQQLRPRLTATANAEEPRGVAFFGHFPTSRLAFAAATIAILIAVIIGVRLNHDSHTSSAWAMEVPPLAPPGASKVEFSDVKSTPDIWAGVVRFDQPDVDITVIWVNGQQEIPK